MSDADVSGNVLRWMSILADHASLLRQILVSGSIPRRQPPSRRKHWLPGNIHLSPPLIHHPQPALIHNKQNDIRMINLKIENLLSASLYIPYTDRLKDGKTPFNYPVQNYIGGVNGQDVQAVVPSLVGTAEGTSIFVGTFAPNDNAYAPLASNPNEFSARVNQVILPNDVSGPEVQPSAFDLDFISSQTSPLFTAKTFHALINQPIILNYLSLMQCQRNTYYFNETFTKPVMRSGNATLYPRPVTGNVPAVIAGRYVRQGGYSASAQVVGYNAETCESAARNLDQKALQ
ncbi:MAG: hypothetical protein Q9190_002883 [Brigantiaea leucoxantha]